MNKFQVEYLGAVEGAPLTLSHVPLHSRTLITQVVSDSMLQLLVQ